MRKTSLITFLLLSISLKSQTFEWANSLGGTSSSDFGLSMALDANGNIYTTGSFGGTADFDPGIGTMSLISEGETDVFIRKMDPSGNLLWAKSFGGIYFDYGNCVSLDPSGNVYISGLYYDTVDFDPGIGVASFISNGNNDAFVAKFDESGNFIWVKTFGGPGSDGGESICFDNDGNVYTTGYFSQNIDIDPGTGTMNISSVGPNDCFIQKLDADGNFVWAKSFGSIQHEVVMQSTQDSYGNIYTLGYYQGTGDFDPNPGISNLSSLGNTDVFIQKLDTAGNFIWAKSIGGTSYDNSSSITCDNSGNLYIMGNFAETVDFDPGTGIANATSLGNLDAFVLKIDSSANFTWVKTFGKNFILGCSIVSDQSSNIYITGTFGDTIDFDPGIGIHNLSAVGNHDVYIQKLDTSGNLVWAKSFGGQAYDLGRSICVDSSGNIYTVGEFGYTVDFSLGMGTGIITASMNQDIFIQKLKETTNGLLEEIDDAKVAVYPNPSEGTMHVVFEKKQDNIEMKLTDTQGKIMFSQNYTNITSIDIHLPDTAGLYFLEVKTNSGENILKLLKK